MQSQTNPSPNLDDVQEAQAAGRLHEWVLDFLRGSGNNPALADRLERDGQYRLHPINYPIEQLNNILGPDDTFKFPEDPVLLEQRVDAIVQSMHNGWRPPAIIATNFWNDEFEIADGGHRAYALLKQGIKTYPTMFYFKDQASQNKFEAKL